MDFIEREATGFYSGYLLGGVKRINNTFAALEIELNNYEPEDQVRFLQILKEKVDFDSKEHEKVCESPLTCAKSRDYSKFIYHINKDIKKLQKEYELPLNDFRSSLNNEKEKLDSEIDKVLAKLNELGLGQEILFDEIQELKKFSNLDKKTFRQIVFGKMGDIVFSEAGSQIADVLKENGYGLKDIFKDLTGTTFKALGL